MRAGDIMVQEFSKYTTLPKNHKANFVDRKYSQEMRNFVLKFNEILQIKIECTKIVSKMSKTIASPEKKIIKYF